MPSKNRAGRPSRQNFGLVDDSISADGMGFLATAQKVTLRETAGSHEIQAVGRPDEALDETSGDESGVDNEEPPSRQPAEDPQTQTIERTQPIKEKIKEHSESFELKHAHKSATPEKFGQYELVWEICRDALSTTYAARTANVERLLAIRIFSSRVTDAAQIRSIQKAATKASELTHVNLVNVYENGLGENGAPYLVTDWVEGETLAEVFRVCKRLDIGRFLGIFNQVCDALIEAHSRLLMHGNLSPNKIILAANDYEADEVKLIDFGMPPDPVQNAFYLSPEQRLDSSRIDARTDIHSLGCLMYEALVGSPPFVGSKMSNASLNYLHELASQYSPDSPEHNALKLLDCIIIKCLQQDPSKRFRHVRELVDALKLVNDCICNGNTRKLPPKAEKLLLFRFLDFFDKKIVACMFAYILLTGLSMKFIGETQLQKYIDEAQLAKRIGSPQAQEYWLAAIQQAEANKKPPSLLADLHWELGDTYVAPTRQFADPTNSEGRVSQAIEQYNQTLGYFSHGIRYQAYKLELLHNIARLLMHTSTEEADEKHRDSVYDQAHKLLSERKFAQCAKLCSEYLLHYDDSQIAFCAALAFNEIGTTLPPEKAAIAFARASYYSAMTDSNVAGPEVTNMNICTETLRTKPGRKYLTPFDIHKEILYSAINSGELEAAQTELKNYPEIVSDAATPLATLDKFFDLERSVGEISAPHPSRAKAIKPLEQALAIEEKSYGLHDPGLAPTLTQLAECYKRTGDVSKAINAYDRLFELEPPPLSGGGGTLGHTDRFVIFNNYDDQTIALDYLDLLCAHGKSAQAVRFMEKRLLTTGVYNTRDPLFIRLLKAYVDQKQTAKLSEAIKQFLPPPQ